ncbi:unnamed protein product, partial [Nesidiocoris tenuis]
MVVFQNGGRRRRAERWYFRGEQVEVVKEYTYLGVTLTPRLSYVQHTKRKGATAKTAMNIVWGNAFSDPAIPVPAKLKVFHSVVKAILCYAAQIWGAQEYASVEAVQLLFVRRLFHLPSYSPNYLIYLETELDTLSAYTLRLHLDYLVKIAKMPSARLPRIVAAEVIRKG